MEIDIEGILIKVKLITEGKLKAIVSLDFDSFVLRGFRIQESQYEDGKGRKLWIVPPSYRGGVKYHPIVFFPDKNIWEEIQERIFDAYQEAQKNRYGKAFDLSEQEKDSYFPKIGQQNEL